MKKIVLSCAISVFLMSSCAELSQQDAGALTGGVVGGLLGSQFGGGSGQVAAAAVGSMAGMMIGGQIGKSMDRQDRLELQRALETNKTGRTTRWTNPDSGARYTVKPTKTYYKAKRPCRSYVTSAYIDGKKQQLHGKACRNSKGQWMAAH